MDAQLRRTGPWTWELPATGGMRVPGRIFADQVLVDALGGDGSLTQVANVAHLPGILCCSLAMPDIHFGYGFPIGGVAAFDAKNGVVSPGGVGYDINCGVRLVATDLDVSDLGDKTKLLVDQLFRDVPSGVGSSGAISKLPRKEMEQRAGRRRRLGRQERDMVPPRTSTTRKTAARFREPTPER